MAESGGRILLFELQTTLRPTSFNNTRYITKLNIALGEMSFWFSFESWSRLDYYETAYDEKKQSFVRSFFKIAPEVFLSPKIVNIPPFPCARIVSEAAEYCRSYHDQFKFVLYQQERIQLIHHKRIPYYMDVLSV